MAVERWTLPSLFLPSLPPSSIQNMSLGTHRRTATRKVPMPVLALGFSRIGTQSMRIALETLGSNETNHGFTGKPYGRAEWDRLVDHCMAVTDVPHILFAEELIAAYPEAKVILTTAVNAWFEPQTAWKVREFWRIVFLAMFKIDNVTPEIAKARFAAHYDLCKFLEKDIPAGPFPKVNDTQAFHAHMAKRLLPI
ncbi:hypothetical protein DFH09DRAFT_1492689 [Mycena vulgaris]|nr:hypothetical protein DFH09DRAFT_1492689 [Mycena vulgaris]